MILCQDMRKILKSRRSCLYTVFTPVYDDMPFRIFSFRNIPMENVFDCEVTPHFSDSVLRKVLILCLSKHGIKNEFIFPSRQLHL